MSTTRAQAMATKSRPATPTKLAGKSTDGDFVHRTQEMGRDAGFKNVSQIWLDTGTLSYEQVLERLEAGHRLIEDIRGPLRDWEPAVSAGENGHLVLRHLPSGREFRPTSFALGHLASNLDVSSWQTARCEGVLDERAHVRQKAAKTRRPHDRGDSETALAIVRNFWRDLNPSKEYLFRTQTDGTLRAWLSRQYTILDNRALVEIFRDIIPGGRFSHWRDDGDKSTLWGNILIPDSIRQETDSDYGGMGSVGNSEIGRRAVSFRPSLFRAICMNGCIWGQEKGQAFKQVHKGHVDMVTLRAAIRENLQIQIPLMSKLIDRLLGTRMFGWDGAAAMPVFAAVSRQYNLGRKATSEVYDAWKMEANAVPDCKYTGFAVINAVTRSGKHSDDPATWVSRDELGGRLLRLDKGEWSALFGRARSMKAEEVMETFPASK